MIFFFFGGGGKILDKILQKVPHRFLGKFWRQKIAWIFIYQTHKKIVTYLFNFRSYAHLNERV